jgi:pimeloyl-ACP methyl ester carboxylesterase
MTKGIVQEQPPFEVAWRTIDGLKVRYAANGRGDEKVVLFSPWPESIFAFAPVWGGLSKQFDLLAIDLPGFGRSEARDDLFAPRQMGDFIAKAIDAFGHASVHAVGLDVGSPSVLFAALARPALFRSLIRDDYLASYDGDRLTRSAALVRAYPKDLAALAPHLASIKVPVAIVVGRNDPYGLARDAALLRERLPHARLDVLEAGHCVWEERAPEFESIVTQWVSGGFQRVSA